MSDITFEEFFKTYMTSVEARQRLGLSKQRLWALCRSGQLPGAIQRGGQWWIPRIAVESRRKKMLRLQTAKRRKSKRDRDLRP